MDPNEMRITFFGTSCIPRLSQECNSIFVEVGSGDQFIFDCGSGVVAKYTAMGIPKSKMNKIFLTHLHGDHMSDLSHIYSFGPSEDRKFPLCIWGPGNTNWTYTDPDGKTRGPFEDGLRAFCEKFRELMRWHTESFSFGPTRYADPQNDLSHSQNPDCFEGCDSYLVGNETAYPDDPYDAYAIYAYELNYKSEGIAYKNYSTGVSISYFPVIHCRRGSIGYKLNWNGMSLVFSGDTKPNYTMLKRAEGADILIHEMVMPADVWTTKNTELQDGDVGWDQSFAYTQAVQNSSHTPQGALGYMLSQISSPPRLTIATHFQAADDTMASALQSIENKYNITEENNFTFASDLMVFNVSKTNILQRKAIVSAFAFNPPPTTLGVPTAAPIYWRYDDDGNVIYDPYAQIDTTDEIPRVNDDGSENWDETGY
ncbi:MBL fold metallo-hydrolase [Desulfoluna sp.]|uniref:MBL fold metallo-hydrolase n=1 Tax=Desulfoluna sp. TaxID=2045199 RepID=UPI0026193B86|nr:MBL fold metallo-hydrolase [Desulfoluna sp.]